MKIIFLDIDGVLNCDKTPNPRKFPYIVDKKLLARFKKLLDRTGAKVDMAVRSGPTFRGKALRRAVHRRMPRQAEKPAPQGNAGLARRSSESYAIRGAR